MSRLPERVEGDRILLSRWLARDAERQHRAIVESAGHLRPWMSWMADEPQPLEARRAMIDRWEQEWAHGGDVYLGVFVNGQVAGSTGLHTRRGPGTLEIGYWTHVSFLRQGIATKVAALLTETVLALSEIERVEIRHDKANVASSGVPRRLGYRYAGDHADGVEAPAEIGVECIWTIGCDAWSRRGERNPK